MPDPIPTKSFIDVLEQVAEGGLLRMVASKSVQEAIGRLVSGVTDVPVAYLESWVQSIRSDALAKKQITATIASTANSMVSGDANLVARGLERYTRKFAARQNSIDGVALRTIDILAETKLPLDAEPPAEDFMRMFEDIAERASSEAVSDLLARILAGEIRKPKSVSLKTLQTVAVIDKPVIDAFQKVRSRLIDKRWVHAPHSQDHIWRQVFYLLSSVAITNELGARTIGTDTANRCGMNVGSKMILLECEASLGGTWYANGANLTMIGEELDSLLPNQGEQDVIGIANGFKELSFVKKVAVGDLFENNGLFSGEDFQEV